MSIPDDSPETTDTDPFTTVRENEAAVEALTDWDGQIGAAARVILALAREDPPDPKDLEIVGIPVGPVGEFATTEGSQ
jgi:hypothetical protein